MFTLTLLIGLYAYSIFLLGLLSLLYPLPIFLYTLFFLFIVSRIYTSRIDFTKNLNTLKKIRLTRIDKIILLIFCGQVIVNLIGALGPELSFDALWNHLTFPKLYLIHHQILHVPGELLYYWGIPKLTELLYTAGLAFGNELIPKVTHLIFGLLACVALFQISRKYLSTTISLIVVLLFYSNPVVGWQSTTAYVDLARTFFEVMAFWAFLNWLEKRKLKWFLLSSVIFGLAISAKLVSLVTIPIYLILIFLQNMDLSKKIKLSIFYTALALFIASPWFAFSFKHSGNPIYPLITNYDTGQGLFLLNPINFIQTIFTLLTRSADPISPLYIIIFPLVLFYSIKFLRSTIRPVFVFGILSLIVWYFTPQSGGGRFILPFLPAFSLLSVAALAMVEKKSVKKYLIGLVLFLSIVSIGYRGIANQKYVPLLLGKESKEEFLKKNLHFSFGDFYDTDNYFKNNLKEEDTVLLYGFHNLYYVDFNFIHESWVMKGDRFNYIATQNSVLPNRFSFFRLVYYNPVTNVRLYSIGGQMWSY